MLRDLQSLCCHSNRARLTSIWCSTIPRWIQLSARIPSGHIQSFLFPGNPNRGAPFSTRRHRSDNRSHGLPSTASSWHPQKPTAMHFAADALKMQVYNRTSLCFRSLDCAENRAECVLGLILDLCFHQQPTDAPLAHPHTEQNLGLLLLPPHSFPLH